MSSILSDTKIQQLLNEPKLLPARWQQLRTPSAREHSDSECASITVNGENGSIFKLYSRRNPLNQLDFSIILTVMDSGGGETRLLRYNGKHPSKHTNQIEGTVIKNDFHIHIATERYQQSGRAIDGYAQATTKYATFEESLDAMLADNKFIFPGQDSRQPHFVF